MHAQCPQRPESAESPGTRAMNSFKPSCVCWEPNLGALQEQQVLPAIKPSPAPRMAALVPASSVFCTCRAFSKYLLNKSYGQ